MSTLLLVDIQNDFCPGGVLATRDGDRVARRAAELIAGGSYDAVIATQDWHIDPGEHFVTWPPHCRAESHGAQLHPAIPREKIDALFHKGAYSDGYSGFDNTGLAKWLRSHGVTSLDVVGIAADHCVRATVLDALGEGFSVRVLRDIIAAVDDRAGEAALADMRDAGAIIA